MLTTLTFLAWTGVIDHFWGNFIGDAIFISNRRCPHGSLKWSSYSGLASKCLLVHKIASVAECSPHRAPLLPGPSTAFLDMVSAEIRLVINQGVQGCEHLPFGAVTCRRWGNGKHLRARENELGLHSLFPNQKRLQSSFPPWVRKVKWYKTQPIPLPRGLATMKPLGDANWIFTDWSQCRTYCPGYVQNHLFMNRVFLQILWAGTISAGENLTYRVIKNEAIL